MQKFIISTLLLVLYSFGIGQTTSFSLTNEDWNFSNKGNISETVQLSAERLSDSDFEALTKSIRLVSYQVFEAPLQKMPGEIKHNFLRFLVGVNNHDEGILIPNLNGNESFVDDHVHYFNYRLDDPKKIDSARLILISTDSLPLKNENNKMFYASSSFYCRPVIKRNHIKNEIKYNLSLVVKNYYSIKFNLGNDTYEMAVFSHPVTQLFYEADNLYWGTSRLRYLLYRLKDGIRDSIIGPGAISDLSNSQNPYPLLLKGHQVRITDFNKNYTQLTLTFDPLNENIGKAKSLNNIYSNRIKARGVFEERIFSSGKKKVLFFSGSWCLPCIEVLPYFKEVYSRFSDQVEFIEILAENKLSNALKYNKEVNPAWNIFYENLKDTNANRILNILNIRTYPSFILLDENNLITSKFYGSDGLAGLDLKLNEQSKIN